MGNLATLENINRNLVNNANKNQNQMLPPRVFDSIINTVSSFYKSALIKSYPFGEDILRPFLKTASVKVVGGYATMPSDYRDRVGPPSIAAKKDKSGECGEEKIETPEQFEAASKKAQCETRPVTMVSQEEWDLRTTSNYKKPTYWDPIGCFFDSKLKVCPYDLSYVTIRYTVEDTVYKYGYINQPDDTYIYDKNTSVELEWGDNAYPVLYKGCLALYATFLRDNQLTEASKVLNELGLF